MKRGFTLIEIMVAIAIVAVLSTVTFAMFSDGRRSAVNIKFVAQIVELEKALHTYVLLEKLDSWPKRGFSSSHINSLDGLLAGTSDFPDFPEYFPSTFEVPYDLDVRYDHRQGFYDGACTGSNEVRGVNLSIRGDSANPADLADIYERLNEVVDGDDPYPPGNQKCGRVRRIGGSGSIYFLIAEDEFDTY